MRHPGYIEKINALSIAKEPFIFIINYKANNAFIEKISQVKSTQILYNINGITNADSSIEINKTVMFEKVPKLVNEYKTGFNYVLDNLKRGNSYLTNFTCETPIKTNLSLKEIFYKSKAIYKLWYNNEFVVFSPETFIKIKDRKILSFPMKGTINANMPNAKELILNNKKEAAEHATIVDLIRNDLSQVADNVAVDKYRYIDRLKTNQGDLLQVSSQISGNIASDYLDNLGWLIYKLLPAGSISGAPKNKTLQIIEKAEQYNRKFYTGIFGIFDGKNLDCGVMIRFIENQNGNFVFKSGGGITANSNHNDEYNEMVQKVYLPF